MNKIITISREFGSGGKGVNVILREYNPMNLFVYANMKSKINRCRMKRKTIIFALIHLI